MFGKMFETKEPQATLARSLEELGLKQQANAAAWGLGSTDRWDADLEKGTIQFSNADGFTVTADVQVIGTYNSEDGTWLWGWDHPSVEEPLAYAAKLARAFGEKHRLNQFTTRTIRCSQEDAWQFTAVALHLSGGAGSYRGPSGSAFVFMTFGEVTIRRTH
jgi:hypothetical protein